MKHSTPFYTIGIDLGKNMSHVCVLDRKRDVHKQIALDSTPKAFAREFRDIPSSRIVMEACGISAWVSRFLGQFGHEVIVANPRNVALISKGNNKSDRVDAEFLARLGASDLQLLSPITHRGEQAQQDLAKIKLRDVLVRTRVTLLLSLRGNLESLGLQLPKCSSESAHKKLRAALTKEQIAFVEPMLAALETLTNSIRRYDREIEGTANKEYPEAQLLQTAPGVGPLISLAYVLTVDDPKRFKKSRDVGAFVGLTPRRHQSGGSDPQLRITKAGNRYLRQLLVQSANYILGPFAKDSDLRTWGLKLADRGGKNAKKRAIVAVARKLATILHRMWMAKTEFNPLRGEPHVKTKRILKSRMNKQKQLITTP